MFSSTIYNCLQMLGLAAGSAALSVLAGYHTMAPRSQLYGQTFIGSRRGRELALTFDDGPNDPYTFQLLEILAKHDVTATFFMIGKYVDRRPDIAQAVVQAGHVVGNHTYTHPNLIFQSQWQVRDEIGRCERALRDAVGERYGRLFRPPFGGRRPGSLRTIRAMGWTPVMWNVTGFDWNAKSAEFIEGKVTRQVKGGDVVLLHDGGHLQFGTDRGFTIQAVEKIVARYKGEGYRFRTIPEMMGEVGDQVAAPK
jgi:peptidoglycan-N-acetylglucosamine deacetylase